MTINDGDVAEFEDTTESFIPQHEFTDCLPAVVKNVLDNLSARKSLTVDISLSEMHDICDYNELLGSTTRNISSRLEPELPGYQVTETTRASFDDLSETIDKETASLPVIDLNADYFDSIDGARILEGPPGAEGSDSFEMTHTIIPFKINSETVLYYDPLESIYTRSSRIDSAPKERPKAKVYEWWSNTPDTRWALWIERKDQETF